MRKSNLAVGMVLSLAASVALTGIAHGAVTGQRLTVTAAPAKMDRKVPSAVGIGVTVDTFEVAPTDPSQTAAQTVLRFDPDFTLGRTNNLAQCNPSTLANTSTVQALALCGPTQVGSGNSTERHIRRAQSKRSRRSTGCPPVVRPRSSCTTGSVRRRT